MLGVLDTLISSVVGVLLQHFQWMIIGRHFREAFLLFSYLLDFCFSLLCLDGSTIFYVAGFLSLLCDNFCLNGLSLFLILLFIGLLFLLLVGTSTDST